LSRSRPEIFVSESIGRTVGSAGDGCASILCEAKS
jgi:hypothetical protein